MTNHDQLSANRSHQGRVSRHLEFVTRLSAISSATSSTILAHRNGKCRSMALHSHDPGATHRVHVVLPAHACERSHFPGASIFGERLIPCHHPSPARRATAIYRASHRAQQLLISNCSEMKWKGRRPASGEAQRLLPPTRKATSPLGRQELAKPLCNATFTHFIGQARPDLCRPHTTSPYRSPRRQGRTSSHSSMWTPRLLM